MQIRRYEAVDMGEALKMVKKDLGPDAVILSSRKVTRGGGKFGMFGRPVIEVTAAIETPNVAERKDDTPRRYTGARAYGNEADGGARPASGLDGAGLEAMKRTAVTVEPILDGIADIRGRLTAMAAEAGGARNGSGEHLAGEVRELRSMMEYLLDHTIEEKEKGDHKNYRALSKYLKEQGVAPEFIRGIINEIKSQIGDGPAPDIKTLVYTAAARMRDTVMFCGAIGEADDEERRVIALIGPTGVGKTTTVAKLAASAQAAGKRVGLITIDTYRIAAVEQLKIYARILNIPLEVVLSPGGLKEAVRAFGSKDVVLIDTAGRSQRDLSQIDELKGYMAAVPGAETRLTLSAAASDTQLDEAVRNFSRIGVDGFIFTKLDEAVSNGAIYNQLAKTGLPASYFTTGQRVPEDIEEASARRMLGGLFRFKDKKETKAITHA